jgi:hypothetical protein
MNKASEEKIAGIPVGSRVAYGTEHRRRGTLVGWRSGRGDQQVFATIDNDFGFREDAPGDDVELALPEAVDASSPHYRVGGMLHLQICPTKRLDDHQGLVCQCGRRTSQVRPSW